MFHVKDQIGNKLTDKSLVNHIEQVFFVACLETLEMQHGVLQF